MASYQRPQSGAVTTVGVLSIVYGALIVLAGLIIVFAGAWFVSLFMGVASEAAKQSGDAKTQEAAKEVGGMAGILLGWITFCGVLAILYGIFPILGGIAVLKRTGKTMTFVFAILALIWGGLSLISLNVVGVILHLGFGLTAVIILPKHSHEFAPAGSVVGGRSDITDDLDQGPRPRRDQY